MKGGGSLFSYGSEVTGAHGERVLFGKFYGSCNNANIFTPGTPGEIGSSP